jgi:hypothetical protein
VWRHHDVTDLATCSAVASGIGFSKRHAFGPMNIKSCLDGNVSKVLRPSPKKLARTVLNVALQRREPPANAPHPAEYRDRSAENANEYTCFLESPEVALVFWWSPTSVPLRTPVEREDPRRCALDA